MKTLVIKPHKLDIDYDEKNDVLYISVAEPKEADDSVKERAIAGGLGYLQKPFTMSQLREYLERL